MVPTSLALGRFHPPEGEALSGNAPEAVATAGQLLASGNAHLSLLRRARGIAFARIVATEFEEWLARR